jgi:N-carbamoylputrescine amidase
VKRKLSVAAVQAKSENGEVSANLAGAAALVERAANGGAELVLCPEFLAAGYVYHASIWRSAEPRRGPTERWLAEAAARHRIFIGASYLEARGKDFFNTFTLVGPDGEVRGRVSKESLPAFEGFYFKSCVAPKIIDTELGRIAVGICQDNHTARFMSRVVADGADLVLMPHSGPCVRDPLGLIRRSTRAQLGAIASYYARAFGVPVVMVNKANAGETRSPIPVVPFARMRMRFPGLSTICAAGGDVLEQLADEEGVAIADVEIDEIRAKKKKPDVPSGYWSNPPTVVPRLSGAAFIALELLGKAAYATSLARRRAARAVLP